MGTAIVAVELTDGNLSRHIGVLEAAGLVRVDKGFEGKRPPRGSRRRVPGARRSTPSLPRFGS